MAARPRLRSLSAAVVLMLVAPHVPAGAQGPARAAAADSGRRRPLDTVRVIGRVANLIGTARTASEGHVGTPEFRLRPIAREGELLEAVPGLVATQHSGDGKANQYFVRGFNLDHGTDFQTTVEGMPVNQPTHAHGQGYTDLNFITPEFVRALDYKLGAYHAELGDFGSAGGAQFLLARRFDAPVALTEFGGNGLARVVLGRSGRVGGGDLLVGGEAKAYDGPWQRAEHLRKFSGMVRYSKTAGASQLSVLAMAYRNRWDATDQVPERAVERGLIGAFGQVDSTLGGSTQRYSLSASYRHIGAATVRDVQVYAIRSQLDLFSNFTYFLDNPDRGDQFEQADRRSVVGVAARQVQSFPLLGATHVVTTGLQSRADVIDVGLYHTERRARYDTVRTDRVMQWGTGLFADVESHWMARLRSVLGARADAYAFAVRGDNAANGGRRAAGLVSPKASLIWTVAPSLEAYASAGLGFHSNDARGTTITVDPTTGRPASRVDPLVRSRGAELGVRVAPVTGWQTTVAAWALHLDSELLFVGDAGATEPAGASQRRGVTVANFYRPVQSLSLDADLSLARARLVGAARDAARIPGAMERVIAGGIAWSPLRGVVRGAIRVRHLGGYPLVETDSVRAPATTLVHADVSAAVGRGARLQVTVFNAFDARASDIRYLYTSRLRDEAAEGVTGVHSHPVEPRQVRASLGWTF